MAAEFINLPHFLKRFEIHQGPVYNNTVDAWLDTDCEATRELFAWMYSYLDENNTISSLEEQE